MGGKLFVETHTCNLPDVDNFNNPMPVMKFYPNKELAGDPTNWWGPNNTCVIQMLQSLGFNVKLGGRTEGDRCAYLAEKELDNKEDCPANPLGTHKKL